MLLRIAFVIVIASTWEFIDCQLQSPCPDVFQYSSDGNENFGIVKYSKASAGQNYFVEVDMSIEGDLTSDFSGRIRLFGGTGNAINDKNELVYKLTYPDQNRLPTITEIRLNKEVICSGPKNAKYGVTMINLQHRYQAPISIGSNSPSFQTPIYTKEIPVYQPVTTTTSKPREFPTQPRRTTTSPPKVPTRQLIANICGRTGPIPLPLLIGGEPISHGSWPWLVAMYDIEGFRCGASLITSKSIITSAHCLGTQRNHISPESLRIAVGKHNISDFNEKFQLLEVDRIVVHPDFKDNNNYDADIAIMVLKGRVRFTDYVRPICLWSEDPNFYNVIGKSGTVVGWGRWGQSEELSTVPKIISVPIIDGQVCQLSNREFFDYTSTRTFCAGNRDGEGPCKGDSGGGLAMLRNNRWTLRGTVSASLGQKTKDAPVCDLTNYVIYSDVAKFRSWIDSFLVY